MSKTGAAMVKAKKQRAEAPAGGPSLRHPGVVKAVRELRTVVVAVKVGGELVKVPGDEVLPTPSKPEGSPSLPPQPKNQDIFLTCGNPAGTLPTTDPCDRAHDFKGGGGQLTRSDKLTQRESVARRYPPGQLSSKRFSIDSQVDAQVEREWMLADWGVAGYGDAHAADLQQQRWRSQVFAHRDKQSVRRQLRKDGLSQVAGPVLDDPNRWGGER